MPDGVEIRFSSHLKRFIDLPEVYVASGRTVREIVNALEERYPGISGYLTHENGNLRQHVNLFLDDRLITDRIGLSDSVESVKTIHVMQALSGG